MTERIAYPLREAADQVGQSADTLRRAFKNGEIAFKEHGGRYYVSRDELHRWFESLPPAVPSTKRRAS